MPGSRITPLSTSIRTVWSYSSTEEKNGGAPAAGQRRHRMLRQLAWPVSALRYSAEFADRASSDGSHCRSQLLT